MNGDHNEGELKFVIGEEDGNVVLKFDMPVEWFGMPPEQAVRVAEALIAMARIIAQRQGKPLTVRMS